MATEHYLEKFNKPLDYQSALSIFDALEAVNCDELLGFWYGDEVDTGHELNGVLQKAHWLGKRFVDTETVYPLVHQSLLGNEFYVRPWMMPLGILVRYPNLHKAIPHFAIQLLQPLIQTSKSAARLRLIQFRDKFTAAMQYDHLPINDVFVRVDNNTLLGCMDFKHMSNHFFFLLSKQK